MALAALVLLAVLAVVVVVLAVRQVRLGVQHQRTRLLVDALDARVGGVQRRREEVPGIGTGRHEVALVLNPIKTHADRVRRELERLAAAEGLGEVLVLETQEDDPGTAMARQALERIEGAGGRALEGIRAIVAASREDEEPTAPATAPHNQSLDDVARLVDDFAHTTTASPSLTRRGEAPVATPIAAAAYRIVAESLNNVHRHAVEPQAIEVLLDTSGAALVIEVTDDGHDPYDDTDRTGSPGGGWGLEGIAERADLVGGHVQTGPLPQGGWRVRAVLPMEGPGPASSTLTPRAPSEPHGAI